MNVSFLIGALLLLLLSVVLAGSSLWSRSRSRSAVRRRLDRIMGSSACDIVSTYPGLLMRWLSRLTGAPRLARAASAPMQAEIRQLLARAGWYRGDALALFHAASVLLPAAAMALAATYGVHAGLSDAHIAALLVIGSSLGFLLPRYLLRYRARRRQGQIAREVPVMLRILNVLFEASLSLEHALTLLRDQPGELLPALSPEIDLFVRRISAGVSRVAALEQIAADMDVPELTDAVMVLTQSALLGTGVKNSLERLAQTIEERDLVTTREMIGRLSAKMTIVMVIFLFPALFIFLAGPGLLAVGHALGGVSG